MSTVFGCGFYYRGAVCLQVLMGEDGDKVKLGEVVELLQDPIFFGQQKTHHSLDAGGKHKFNYPPEN